MEQQRARWPAFKFCNIVNTCLVVLYKLWEQKCKCTQTDLHTHHQNYFYSMYDVGGNKSCELISFTWKTAVGSLCMKRICFRIHNWNETFFLSLSAVDLCTILKPIRARGLFLWLINWWLTTIFNLSSRHEIRLLGNYKFLHRDHRGDDSLDKGCAYKIGTWYTQ
jgi:hypothetical protein